MFLFFQCWVNCAKAFKRNANPMEWELVICVTVLYAVRHHKCLGQWHQWFDIFLFSRTTIHIFNFTCISLCRCIFLSHQFGSPMFRWLVGCAKCARAISPAKLCIISVSALYELWCCNICRCIKLCENSTNFSPVGCRCCWSCCCCSLCCWCRCLCGCWVCDAGEFMLDKHLAKLIFAIWREEPLPKNASSHREKEIKEKRKNIAWIIRIVGFTKKFFFVFFFFISFW